MLLDYIKESFSKRILRRGLHNVVSNSSSALIEKVGLLIDEKNFLEKEVLIKEFVANGILEKDIEVLVYKANLRKNAVYSQPTFSLKNLNWKGKIKDPVVNEFIAKKFDLLVSYYDIEKSMLMRITHDSKSQFKVGFSSIDNRLNHLIINTNTTNYKVFVHELFKYLKVLNKI